MLDVGYAIRLMALFWRYKGKKANKDLFCETVIHGRCWLNDLDSNMHMNNSRYLRECDFGRVSIILETGLWNALMKRKKGGLKDANMVVSALQVQYRRSIELGDQFEIRTRINGWDDKAFYLEQAMILEKNRETAFLMLIRFALTPRSLTPQMLVDDLQIGSMESPTLSPALETFRKNYKLNYLDIKSKI